MYSKYKNKKTPYNNVMYDSVLEAGFARELDLRLRANDIKFWIRQVKVPIKVNGIKICNYIVDFKISHNDGTAEFIEVKGVHTAAWNLKKKLFIATYLQEHPNDKYRIIYKDKEVIVK